ncbi:MAG: GNAT family N-acetyltransferase [Vicinamibacterales bacterium]|jgi:GNAT superfamily N-acetyltransferase|nr:GNAT family N-acetyltransferase [Acidobacteriota bacterium]MDP6373778.1 GNAT family N-acetyltransferase [Vicinamibacterales bacterium]MDP6608222.1 GNAT family N-acetyltransferase [Vicinamibacterales bacterium]HAK55184.1 GNAT family N-acetyltransferase [Acidobacteriota bacterium]|tara:strand:- start:1290 stop:1721 length:432 start_codon:yes stop_codon:yes gene_type:complete
MTITLAVSDDDIARCYPIMRELRPAIAEVEFVARIRVQEDTGYRLAIGEDHGVAVAAAGFRLGENLAWGRYVYVDDLVTSSAHRSKGHGRELLAWLVEFAQREGCDELHLDSGVWRKDAHRFYEREGMEMTSYHFKTDLRVPS